MTRVELSVEGLGRRGKDCRLSLDEKHRMQQRAGLHQSHHQYGELRRHSLWHHPSGSATVQFLLLTVDADSLIAWNDTVTTPAYPITLPAQHLFGIFNADETYATTGNPLLQFKANTNPTNLFLAIGLA